MRVEILTHVEEPHDVLRDEFQKRILVAVQHVVHTDRLEQALARELQGAVY